MDGEGYEFSTLSVDSNWVLFIRSFIREGRPFGQGIILAMNEINLNILEF